ncbi:MAG TPA: fatty acid desaturase [Pirellulales bacterium]|nr:fatty acid desaturase [Pirellulales bacterium]
MDSDKPLRKSLAGAVSTGEPRPAPGEAPFYLREMRATIVDLFDHKPWIYWADFLLTTAIGYAGGAAYLTATFLSVRQVLAFFVAGFAIFRAATFIHEIVHMRQGLMPAFRVAWNVLFGVPMMMPSLLYSNHTDHHRRRHYGTEHDGEYQPFARRPISHLARYWGLALAMPLLAYFRFLILVPLSLVNPRLRRWLFERFSSYGFNFRYRREPSKSEPYQWWLLTDVACFACAVGLAASVLRGRLSPNQLLGIYLLAVFTIGLNWLRNLAGHHFRNEGGELSAMEQLADSVTISGHPLLTELLFPLGLRYHALHHLYPSLPYHALGTAHRRLMATLPADAVYRQTVYPSFWSVLKTLVGESLAATRHEPAQQPASERLSHELGWLEPLQRG